MKQQIIYFKRDVKRMIGRRKSRILYVWLSRSFAGIFLYRLERGFFLTFGELYRVMRIFFIPIINLIQAYSNIDIHYKANIAEGLSILHPSMGVVVSGKSIIGSNLTLTGGNVIGVSKKCTIGEFVIGNDCNLGANGVIMGPLIMGNNIKVGASACVVNSFNDSNITLIGVPARIYKNKSS